MHTQTLSTDTTAKNDVSAAAVLRYVEETLTLIEQGHIPTVTTLKGFSTEAEVNAYRRALEDLAENLYGLCATTAVRLVPAD